MFEKNTISIFFLKHSSRSVLEFIHLRFCFLSRTCRNSVYSQKKTKLKSDFPKPIESTFGQNQTKATARMTALNIHTNSCTHSFSQNWLSPLITKAINPLRFSKTHSVPYHLFTQSSKIVQNYASNFLKM